MKTELFRAAAEKQRDGILRLFYGDPFLFAPAPADRLCGCPFESAPSQLYFIGYKLGEGYADLSKTISPEKTYTFQAKFDPLLHGSKNMMPAHAGESAAPTYRFHHGPY